MHIKATCGWFVVLLLAARINFAAAAELVSFGDSWTYFIGTREASTPTEAWRAAGYDDAGWAAGTAPIGFALAPDGWETSISTPLPTSAAANYLSVFFRHNFVVTNVTDITQLSLLLHVDDAYIAWLNGVEVGRFGVPNGSLPYNTPAPSRIAEGEEISASVSPVLLISGTNVLAIQVFQAGLFDDDLLMDVALTSAIDADPPTVTVTSPVQGSIVRELKFISVVFSEAVTGVEVSDLLINNEPATNLLVVSTIEYQFRFPPPPTGEVSVAWAPAHGITDVTSSAHPFAGGSWGYVLDPNAGPKTLILSEFLTDNEKGREDEDGSRSDWIEVYNPGPLEMNLDGWFLTDARTNLTAWRFPALTLAAGRYLLVWASEKNRTNPLAPLHTNFKLSKNAGSYLGLADPNTNIISEFVSYPAQRADVSYGRDAADPTIVGFFPSATPGAQNITTGAGFAGDPSFSLDSGIYTTFPVTLAMTAPPGTTIRYTTNNTLPGATSTLYTGPLTFSANATIRARVFQAGLLPGRILSRNFIFLDASTREFNSNLPVLILSSEGRPISSDLPGGATNRTKGTFAVFDTFRGRASLARKPDFLGNAQFEGFGQTSAGWAKRPYNVEINNEVQNDMAVSILGMPAEADWKLRNPWTDKCMMNDFLAFELFEQMGRNSVRRRLVEVFRDEGGGRVSYPADYYGVMLFSEKIEAGDNRVDINELTPSQTNEPAITGGYMFKKDKDSGGDLNFNTRGGGGFAAQALKLHEPKPRDVNNSPNHPQVVWLRNYLNLFETNLYATNWLTRTGTNHYSHYIDVDSFVDQYWIVEFPKQIDGYRLSCYYSKDRNGKVRPEPIWDWNLSFGNADYLDGGHTNTWYWELLGDADHIWLRRMITGTPGPATIGDPDFRQKVADRWGVLRTNVFNGERLLTRIDEVANLLTESAGRNYIKYTNQLLGVYHWPNPNGRAGGWDVDYVNPRTYAGIITEMKKWTYGRYLWIDGRFIKAPALSLSPGPIQAGASLAFSAPTGSVYYTLDGSDPRAPRGEIAPGAQLATGPIVLNSNARVVTRAYVSPTSLWSPWSPPTVATYVVQTPGLAITEIMYHPSPAPGSTLFTDEDFEYIELKNVGSTPLDLAGYSISGGIDFVFPSLQLEAGSRVVVVKNQDAFVSRYGNAATIAGQYTGNLANDGNRLALWGSYREPIQDFSYDDDWHPITDGFGFSLVVVDENATVAAYGLASNWRPSGTLGGAPGQDDAPPPLFPQVVINEILTHSDPAPPSDTIELRNLSAVAADIGGWYLTDDFRTPRKFRIPTGRTIEAGGVITFDESEFNVGPGSSSFGLSALGDEVYLFSADVAGNLTGYHHGYEFGAQGNRVTFGRYVNSIGAEQLVTQASASLGSTNSGPAVGPIVISEIMYRPQDVLANGGYWNNTEHEYIELRNITPYAVPLYDPARPNNTWKLQEAVAFNFPPDTSIPARGFLILVSFNPITQPTLAANFRLLHGLDFSAPLLGPYQGSLDNQEGDIQLLMPDAPATDGTVPYLVVDRVQYMDRAPWPTEPDGLGQALHRRSLAAYGNDPANWTASGPTPGSDLPGSLPTIVTQPEGSTIAQAGTAWLTANAIGPGPIRYQWLFNGMPLPGGTDDTLVLENIQPSQAGIYQLVALNPFGSALSAPATLTVLPAPKILLAPAPVSLGGSTNANNYGSTTNRQGIFTVIATGTGTLRYQWRWNGQDILGATRSTLVVSNVTLAQEGLYDVLVSDDVLSVRTEPVRLTVLIPPVYLITPVPQFVVSNGTFTASAAVRGNPPPFRFMWRDNTTVRGSNVTFQTTNFFTSGRITNLASRTWQLSVFNDASSVGTLASFAVIALADADNDGIPDVWETQFGFDAGNGADKDHDSDGDGMSNYAEYIAGTDPTNSLSHLRVDISPSNGRVVLQVGALSNHTYSVSYSTQAVEGTWTKLLDITARRTNRVETIELDLAGQTNRYYRLGTPQQP